MRSNSIYAVALKDCMPGRISSFWWSKEEAWEEMHRVQKESVVEYEIREYPVGVPGQELQPGGDRVRQLTVGELIYQLAQFPQEAKVFGSTYGDSNGGFFEVEEVGENSNFDGGGVLIEGGWDD